MITTATTFPTIPTQPMTSTMSDPTTRVPAGPAPATTPPVSCMLVNTPKVIYQTALTAEGKQDSSTELVISMALSATARAAIETAIASGSAVADLVHGAIRRFDGKELEVFDEKTGLMLGVRLPQLTFRFELVPGTPAVLEIHVHRKELPVGRAYGEAPFRFYFYLKPVGELVSTSIFMVASKQPPPATKPRRTPKRVRGPPPRRPHPGVAAGAEAQVSAMIARLMARGDEGQYDDRREEEEESESKQAPAPRKRVRVHAPPGMKDPVADDCVDIEVMCPPAILPVDVGVAPPRVASPSSPIAFSSGTTPIMAGLDADALADAFAEFGSPTAAVSSADDFLSLFAVAPPQ